MSTGVWHYLEAERLARETGNTALAQVHATLALAAAAALGQREVPAGDEDSFSTSNLPYDDYIAWWKAASEGPAARQRREEAAEAEREEFSREARAHRRALGVEYAGGETTAEWFTESKAAGCTGTSYDTDSDSILHEIPGPCPVHPGLPDYRPAEGKDTAIWNDGYDHGVTDAEAGTTSY